MDICIYIACHWILTAQHTHNGLPLVLPHCSLTGSIATTDLFDDTVRDMFSIADTQQKGHLTREEFESVRIECQCTMSK